MFPFDLLEVGNTIGMTGMVLARGGENKMYLCLFPQETRDNAEIEVLPMNQEQWLTLLKQTDIVETEVLALAADKSVVKTVLRKSQRTIDSGVQWTCFKRDGYACRYCGNDSCPLTVDHLVCWEVGGPSIPENLVTACRKCNKVRGNDTYEDWLVSNHYTRVSTKLSPEVRAANAKLAATLPGIPRRYAQRSR
jgi:hypothetical protein